MAIADDPIDVCMVDETETLQHALPLAESVTGFANDQELPADKFNTIARSAAIWKRWLDQGRLPTRDAVGKTTSRLSSDVFEYTTVPGLVQSLTVDETFYLINGYFVRLSVDRIEAAGLSNITTRTFVASKDTHFYLEADGTIEAVEVTVGTPPSPGPGQWHLKTVTTNATDVIGQVDGDDFAEDRLYTTARWVFNNEARITDDGSNTATLAFRTEADANEGWEIRVGPNGGDLRLHERNLIDGTIVEFGNATDPVVFHRATKVDDNFEATADVVIGAGRTHTASGWLNTRTHNNTSTENAWGMREATVTAKNVAENATHYFAAPSLANGSYYGTIAVRVHQANNLGVIATAMWAICVNVSGGTATIVYYSTLDYYDPFIGLTTYQPTVTGATLRVTAAIPNLAGSPVFNATVEYRLNYSTVS